MSRLNDPEAATRLARAVVSDVMLYNDKKVRAGRAGGDVLGAVVAELDEGRALFLSRVEPSLSELFDLVAAEMLEAGDERAADQRESGAQPSRSPSEAAPRQGVPLPIQCCVPHPSPLGMASSSERRVGRLSGTPTDLSWLALAVLAVLAVGLTAWLWLRF
ncbi:MAG: hypothetical protein DRI90_02530 [Deltaproteobacteria bacterium]|nr:MAG: hypothetical protein DRI90_02530 [Deltaproteobacteria bacterium]